MAFILVYFKYLKTTGAIVPVAGLCDTLTMWILYHVCKQCGVYIMSGMLICSL